MKRGKLVLLSLISVLVLTGCGSNKELNCSMTDTSSGMQIDANVVVKFDGKTVEDMNITMDVNIPEEYKSQTATMKSLYEAAEFKVEETDKGLRLSAGSDSKYFKDLNLGDTKASYDDTKKQFEAAGYTCK